MNALKEEVVSKKSNSSDFSHDLQDLSNITGKLANGAVNMAQDNISAYYEKGVKGAKKMGKSFEGQIKENPLRSLLIVAGLGLLAGTLWNRRQKKISA